MIGYLAGHENGLILLRDGRETVWVPSLRAKLVGRLARHMRRPEMGFAVRDKRDEDAVSLTRCLWVRTKGRAQADYLLDYQPRPTLVMGKGSQLVGVWALREPLAYWRAYDAGRWLARRMGCVMARSEPQELVPLDSVLCFRHDAYYRPETLVPAGVIGGQKK